MARVGAYDRVSLTLLGGTAVGKSSLVRRFCDDDFDWSMMTNIGIEFREVAQEVDGRKTTVLIWDTAGQERYHEVSTNLTRTADGIIFVYDVMERNSFRRVRHWIQSAQKTRGDGAAFSVPVVVFGNKCDLNRGADEKAGENSPARQVSFEEGYSWAKAIGAKFQETSAFDGTGVHRGFHDIIDAATRRKRAVTLYPHPPARGRHGAAHGPKTPLIPDEEEEEEAGSCWCPWLCCCSQTQTND